MTTKIVIVGDSIALALTTNATGILTAGERVVTTIAFSGHTTADQLAAWLACAQRGDATQTIALIQVGVNDVQTGVALATMRSNLNALISDMRTQNPTMKIILGKMLPARTAASVAPRYTSHYVPFNADIEAADGTGNLLAVDHVMTSAFDALDDGTEALDPDYAGGDNLHPTAAGNRLNAARARENINEVLGEFDFAPQGGQNRGQIITVGAWLRSNMPANQSDLLLNRATSQSTNVLLRRRCRLTKVLCSMDTLGASNPAAGGALTIKVVRMSWQGYEHPTIVAATVNIGESNICKDPENELHCEAGDSVYVQLSTPAGWTSTTCDPSIRLQFTEE